MSTREIQGHLQALYGTEVSPQLISTVTDAVLEEAAAWPSHPLEATYPRVFFDVIRVKVRDEGIVRNKAVYLALGVCPDGRKTILGLWIEQTEGAKFWPRVMNELHNRGLKDILSAANALRHIGSLREPIAVVDGLKGFPAAIVAVFPSTQVRTCIVHLIRHFLSFATWRDRREVVAAPKSVYQAPTAEAAETALTAFEAGSWSRKNPTIAPAWRRQWEQVIPFFAFPAEVRRIIYTTNAIESLNSKVRTAVRSRGHFPNDDAAIKLIFLVLRRIERDWKMPAREWTAAKIQFAIMFGERFAGV